MTGNVLTLPLTAKVQDVIRLMSEHNIGSVVVRDESAVHGIVTERDLLGKVLAYGLKPSTVAVGDVMTKSTIRIGPTKGLREACRAMIAQKGRLLVFDNDHMVGIATASDLTRGVARAATLNLDVGKVMTRRVFTVEETYSVGEAARIMNDKRIGSVLVTRNGQPYGVFTERDLVTKILLNEKPLATELSAVSSRPIVNVGMNVHLNEAARVMADYKIKRLPIYNGNAPIGIVTARDIVEAFAVYG